jgi:hypothetical protein
MNFTFWDVQTVIELVMKRREVIKQRNKIIESIFWPYFCRRKLAELDNQLECIYLRLNEFEESYYKSLGITVRKVDR